ncbi:hypothetical protein [Methanolobus sp. WCC5]|uniref:hypothetical protein n=1 Tax=Methanolobus sp. WCC5 TaxID=3125785 RepID=UPI00324E22F4
MRYKLLKRALVLLLGVALAMASGCANITDSQKTSGDLIDNDMEESSSESNPYSAIIPTDFAIPIENPYFPLNIGTIYIYDGESDEKDIKVEIYVSDQTKEIMGVETTVVRQQKWKDGELIEHTLDWYANDNKGNVWYFGSDSKEYDYDAVDIVSTVASWEAGVDGAEPRIFMGNYSQVGDVYRQEYYERGGEKELEVLSIDAPVSVEYGPFENCIQIKELIPFNPEIEKYKYYASGVGLVLEESVMEGNDRIELAEIINR